jgi:hypothetical protein
VPGASESPRAGLVQKWIRGPYLAIPGLPGDLANLAHRSRSNWWDLRRRIPKQQQAPPAGRRGLLLGSCLGYTRATRLAQAAGRRHLFKPAASMAARASSSGKSGRGSESTTRCSHRSRYLSGRRARSRNMSNPSE